MDAYKRAIQRTDGLDLAWCAHSPQGKELDSSERPLDGDGSLFMFPALWEAHTFSPIAAQELFPPSAGDPPMKLKPVDMPEMWNAYLRVRQSPSLERPDCKVSARVVLGFRTGFGVMRWVSMGRECPYMQTTTSCATPSIRRLFTRIVNILDVRQSIERGDPTMAKLLLPAPSP